MGTKFRSPIPRPLGLVAACVMALPLLLTACGGSTAPANTPQATTGGATTSAPTTAAASAPTAAAATARPAGSAAATTAQPAGSAAAPSGGVAPTTNARPQGTTTPLQNLTLPPDSKRGAGGTLRLLWWQAPTILNLHLSQGTKDFDASRLVEEPLATVGDASSTVPTVPILAKEVPSVANGSVAADGSSVTWKLKDGVVWSDGDPFTADDVIFTWKFITDLKNGATTIANYDNISDITAVDPMTVKITFKAPTAAWFLAFVGSNGAVLPKHILQSCTTATQCAYNQKPIGTGPFVVTDFVSGDHVTYKANDKFRESNAPYFAGVDLKGGGDASTAAKAVITGQADYAWNLQVTPDILKQISDSGQVLATAPGASSEKIYINFGDPSTEVNGEKSSPQSKSPFWSDKNVRMALALAVDREAMAKNLYGPAGVSTNTLIPTIWNGSPWQFDPKKANDLLDAAGWKKGSDGIREKDGKKFAITFRTSITPVRDREAQLIKSNLKDVGIAMDIKNVDSGVFFGQPDNPDNLARFETDIEMYTNGSGSPDMQGYLEGWTSDKIAQKSNGWKGTNVMRWNNPEYDKLVASMRTVFDPAKRVDLFKQSDAIITGDYAQIPLVARASVAAYAKGLEGVNLGAWDSDLWNAAHWTKK